jgi:hypothetical protein
MNESIRARLVDGEKKVPIELVSRAGVVLFGESSAWPRDVLLRLRPISPGTKERFERARQRHGWAPNEVKLNYQLRDGEVVFRGAHPDSLPAGTWELGVDIYDVVADRLRWIEIPDDGECEIELKVKNDVRRMRIRPAGEWDAGLRQVLAASELDGIPGEQWALDGTVRSNRRACALNVLAVCRELGLTDEIEWIFLAEVDRVHARVSPEFRAKVERLGRFRGPKPPGHAIHRRVLDGHGLTPEQQQAYELHSFRQAAIPSLQIVTASPPGGVGPHFADLDIDLGDVYNPLGLVIHTVEIAHPQRTDHLGHVRRMLEDTAAEKFLCWDRELRA